MLAREGMCAPPSSNPTHTCAPMESASHLGVVWRPSLSSEGGGGWTGVLSPFTSQPVKMHVF